MPLAFDLVLCMINQMHMVVGWKEKSAGRLTADATVIFFFSHTIKLAQNSTILDGKIQILEECSPNPANEI